MILQPYKFLIFFYDYFYSTYFSLPTYFQKDKNLNELPCLNENELRFSALKKSGSVLFMFQFKNKNTSHFVDTNSPPANKFLAK